MSSNIITVTIMIDGMTCVNCENRIERKLSSTVGIESVKVSYSNGNAEVSYDPDVISLQQLEEIIEGLDYHVKKQEEKEEKKIDFTNLIAIIAIIASLIMLINRFGGFNIFNAFPVAKEGMGYGMLFIIGLFTSVHCVAMCGGICLSQCVPKNAAEGENLSRWSTLKPTFLYNLGRVISYTLIGAVVGVIGSVVSFSGGMKGFVQIVAGAFMVIMGLNMLNLFPWLRKLNPRMPKIFARKINTQKNSKSPLYIGLLNGLMPCGPLQAMQLYALSTGNAFEGALSMFLFSVGTVPLMFIFGAISSMLSKKFTSKMMSASAVLVVILGVFMFTSGASLSGITIPAPSTSSAKTANVATIKDGVQTVTTSLASGRYQPITVQKGIPVKWIIQAEDKNINGCNNSIVVPKLNLQVDLKPGDNVIEFTPSQSGAIPFSCWMGMIRSKITVVDDLSKLDESGDIQNADNKNNSDNPDNTDNADNSGNTGSDNSADTNGLEDFDNLLEPKIPTDKIAIATIKDGIQTVEISIDENGISPAVVVMQSGLETKWNIIGKSEENSFNLLFPLYYAQIEIQKGENVITLYPDQDFDFFTDDSSYYGYVKVVDDITQIDEEAIKNEVKAYDPTVQSIDDSSGLPSCH